MAILIKDAETDELVRELAARTGETINDESRPQHGNDSPDCPAGKAAASITNVWKPSSRRSVPIREPMSI